MNLYNILALITIIIIIYSCSCYMNYKEGMTAQTQYNQQDKMLKYKEDYWKNRVFANVAEGSDESKFVKVPDFEDDDKSKLKDDSVGAFMKPSDVDKEVEKCKILDSTKNCAYLKGSNCGYCHSNKKFMYGNNAGPLTNTCPGGKASWVGPKDKRGVDWACQKMKDQETCKSVKNCGGSTGVASICAWCPSTQSGMVSEKNSTGGYIPKYKDDKCDFKGKFKDAKTKKLKETSLININDCAAFKQMYPCMGPNWATGPHTQACIQKKWNEAGCSGEPNARVARSGLNAPKISKWWNSHGHGAMLDNMKSMRIKQSSNEYETAKKYTKACSDIAINPCQDRFNERPFECDKQIYENSGCKKSGKLNPDSNEPWAIDLINPFFKYKKENNRNSGELRSLTNSVNDFKSKADYHTRNLKADYGKTIKYTLSCGGRVPKAPWKKPCWKDFTNMMIYITGVQLPRADELDLTNANNVLRDPKWTELKNSNILSDTNQFPRLYKGKIIRKLTYNLPDFPYWNFLTKIIPYLKKQNWSTGISWYADFIPEMIKVPGVIRVGTDRYAKKRGHLYKNGYDELWFSEHTIFHRIVSGYGFQTIKYKGITYTRLLQSRYKAKAGEYNMDYGFPFGQFFIASKSS